ncbi:MAG: hypothetical protein AAFN94_12395 [Pseudomonadota bacterium]
MFRPNAFEDRLARIRAADAPHAPRPDTPLAATRIKDMIRRLISSLGVIKSLVILCVIFSGLHGVSAAPSVRDIAAMIATTDAIGAQDAPPARPTGAAKAAFQREQTLTFLDSIDDPKVLDDLRQNAMDPLIRQAHKLKQPFFARKIEETMTACATARCLAGLHDRYTAEIAALRRRGAPD